MHKKAKQTRRRPCPNRHYQKCLPLARSSFLASNETLFPTRTSKNTTGTFPMWVNSLHKNFYNFEGRSQHSWYNSSYVRLSYPTAAYYEHDMTIIRKGTRRNSNSFENFFRGFSSLRANSFEYTNNFSPFRIFRTKRICTYDFLTVFIANSFHISSVNEYIAPVFL